MYRLNAPLRRSVISKQPLSRTVVHCSFVILVKAHLHNATFALHKYYCLLIIVTIITLTFELCECNIGNCAAVIRRVVWHGMVLVCFESHLSIRINNDNNPIFIISQMLTLSLLCNPTRLVHFCYLWFLSLLRLLRNHFEFYLNVVFS